MAEKNGNNTALKRIHAIIAIATFTLILLASIVTFASRVAILEANYGNIKDELKELKKENAEAHKDILNKLNDIQKDVKK